MSGDERFELLVGVLLLSALPAYVVWRLVRWVRTSPVRSDPWGEDVERIIQQPETMPVCVRCSAPYSPEQWFCTHCGKSVGKYNNWMPYVYLFSLGEVFRAGSSDRIRVSALTVNGYLLLSYNYLVLSPVYWILLFKNLKRNRREQGHQAIVDASE